VAAWPIPGVQNGYVGFWFTRIGEFFAGMASAVPEERRYVGGGASVPSKLSLWIQKIGTLAGGLGAPGLLLISFLDSSVLTFPIINDGILINLSIVHPARMPLYAFMATLGSVLGCVLLYFISRKGGEALFHRKAGKHANAIRHWVERNGFVGILIAALLPPPTPFKIFVFAAGVFEVPLLSYTSAIVIARLLRYFVVGYLAVRYGRQALPYLKDHWLQAVLIGAAAVIVSYVLSRLLLKQRAPSGDASWRN
jgi:membrane protein YqaA with SNARE-associated domain